MAAEPDIAESQAVDELKRQLAATLEQQTAMSAILRAISQSPTDVQSVLDAIAASARRFCGADNAGVILREEAEMRVTAHDGPLPAALGLRVPLDRSTGMGRSISDGRTVHIPDVLALDPAEFARGQELARTLGFRAVLAVPMLGDGQAIGALLLRRSEPGEFTRQQIELLESFAAQAVIAIENARLFTDLREALEQQIATAELLQIINCSPGNLEPVFDAILEKAHSLCDAPCGSLQLYEGNVFRAVADRGLPETLTTQLRQGQLPRQFSKSNREVLQVADVVETYGESPDDPVMRAVVQDAGLRTMLYVPLYREDVYLGRIVAARREVRPFTDKQVALLQAFAAQAVLAMENARLLTEQREALEQQTATAEILRAISQSPTDVQPVLDAVAKAALRFCGATDVMIQLRDADSLVPAVHEGPFTAPIGIRRPLDRSSIGGRAVVDARTIHIPDVSAIDPAEYGMTVRLAGESGARAVVAAPMLRDGMAVGSVLLRKSEAGPFTWRQIGLLETFAAQAVIAIENVRLFTELRESLERQTATTEVLETINGSPGDLQPVFETILAKAMTLCDADFGTFSTFDGQRLHTVATRGVPEAFARYRLSNPPAYGPGTGPAGLIAGEDYVHVIDAADSEAYRQGEPSRRAIVDLGGARTILNVALRKDDVLLGTMSIYRREVRPFSENQIALLQGFAAQAVIAMENARLLGELRASLEQQTATSDVLKIISHSSVNLETVLNTLVDTVARLCRADLAYMFRQEDELYHLVATHGLSDEAQAFVVAHPIAPEDRRTVSGRVALERRTVHIADVLEDPDYSYGGQQIAGYRTILGIPLLRENTLVGIFNVARTSVEPFTAKEIELATSFADQAVIAIENARLFEELRDRQAELRVTFDNMGDGVAMFDGDHRLAAWNRNFQEILGLSEEWLVGRPTYAEYLGLLAERGEFGTENVEAELAGRLEDTERELRLERARADGSVIEVRRNAVPGGGFVLIYADITERRKAEAAIRAARDAAEAALERQTATADILKVIASSPIDVEPVLAAVVKAAVRVCGATDAMIQLRDGDNVMSRAHEGPLTYNANDRRSLDRSTAGGRAIVDAGTCHLPDIEALTPAEFVTARRLAALHGFRAIVAAPLKREDTAIGAVVLRKVEPGPFTLQQIALLETFAAQAVIAIENVRLFTELKDSLERLKAAQANLIQSEKMASLGQLTAGIAHEIKNPLNFVNNFASLSVELLDELKEVAEPVLVGMNEDARAEFRETIEMITSNLDKIAEHGKRADGIVKSMLSHSRGGSGDWQESNINALVEEALNLAYHGARAQDKEFNVTLERDFAPFTQPIELVPQDVTRVFLNLFGNGFYAANKRRLGGGEAGYRPTLKVSTRIRGEAVEVRVRDNGIGIPPEVRAKLFQPFFTTKPTGEGTGLGLSISYDIVTQQHGGTIEVESEPGAFTEFVVRLPHRRRAGTARRTR